MDNARQHSRHVAITAASTRPTHTGRGRVGRGELEKKLLGIPVEERRKI